MKNAISDQYPTTKHRLTRLVKVGSGW